MLTSIIFSVAATAGTTVAPSIADCNIQSVKEVVLDVQKLPTSVQAELGRYAPKLASRDGDYQKGDLQLGPSLPAGRFLGGAYNNRAWVVVYEMGVTGMLHALTFRPSASMGNGRAFRIVPNGHLVGPMCDALRASFADVRSPG